MKKIAFVSPMGLHSDPRGTKEVKSLLSDGNAILFYGWDRNGLCREKVEEIYAGEKVRFHFCGCRTNGGLGGIKGIFKLVYFVLWVFFSLTRDRKEIDCVHMCNLDAGLGAFVFCKLFGKKYVYDIYDYYVDSHYIPFGLSHFIENFEIALINSAEVVIICIETRMEQISKSNPKQVVVIHNSPDIIQPMMDEILYDYVYCGSLGVMRLIRETLDLYQDNCDMKFAFAGGGLYEGLSENLSKEYPNFRWLKSLAYEDALKYEGQAMVLSAIYEPSIRNHRFCAPNKFYEAMALGKPVIVCRGTGIDKIVEQEKIGIVIDYDAKQFYEAVRCLKANPQICEEMGKRGRKLYEEKYNWGIMKERLISAYGVFVFENDIVRGNNITEIAGGAPLNY